VYVCTSEVCMGDTRDGGVCRSVIGSGSARKQLMCEAGRRGAWWCRWLVGRTVERR
jgi:hypothetical protein